MEKRLAAWSLCVGAVLLGCPAPKPPPPPESPPAISSFTASKRQVNPGESVTLSWAAERATEATVSDQNGVDVPTTGDATAGSATVAPTKTSYYVLRVKGAGGRDTAFIQVAVGEALSDLTLLPVPGEVAGGRSAELLWAAPAATSASIKYADQVIPLTGTTGVVTVTPARTTQYTLSASGGGKSLTLAATVKVRPVISTFEAVPPAAKPEETISLRWSGSGATELTLTEATFGSLATRMDGPELDEGKLDWKVPKTLPNGQPTPVGLPLLFTLTLKSAEPVVTDVRTVQGYVGDGPVISLFDAPGAVTIGKSASVAWKTVNAYGITLKANGLVVLSPANGSGVVGQGRFQLPSATQDTTFELTARSYNGLTVTAVKKVLAVKPPTLSTFTLPANINAYGDPANAAWTTKDAVAVRIRVSGGAAVHTASLPAQVAAGSVALYPLLTTTFQIDALNAAGDAASQEKTVEVTTPANVKATPDLAVGATSAVVTWDLTGYSATDIYGAPETTPPTTLPAANYVNLDGASGVATLAFATKADAVAQLTAPAGFSFPFLGRTISTFFVSINGVITFNDAGALPDNVNIADTANTAPALLAPFWDDLELGVGQVRYAVDGGAFPRRLTIEWNKVSIAGDPATELTFQVQLLESGEVRYVYKTLNGNAGPAKGGTATVGLQLRGDVYTVQSVYNSATLDSDKELDFFASSQASLTGTYTLRTFDTSVYTLFFRNTAGKYLVGGLPVRVFQPSSVAVNEVMPLPHASVSTSGAWLELRNGTDQRLDLSGLELKSAGSTTGYKFPAGTRIGARGLLLLGQSTDPVETGGAPVERVYTDLPFTAADALTLSALGTPIDSLSWTAAVAGTSVQPKEKTIDAAGNPLTCTRKITYGGTGSIGTPGKVNETCFEYLVEPVPPSYREISSSGQRVFPEGKGDQSVATLQLPFSVPFFGQPKNTIVVSTNGWVGFGGQTLHSDSNKVKPTTADPAGVAAIFWDDLNTSSEANSGVYFQAFAQGGDPANPKPHVIVQWYQYTHYIANDRLNMEVKIFQDGVIEYHYDAMTSGSTSNYANGNSATVWLDKPDGTAALPVSINTASVLPYTAFRFSPRP